MISKAIILAAGMGTRLLPLTETKHKCLTEVNGVPIIMNALSCLYEIGVKETVVVVGYLADDVKKAVGYIFETMSISYVENRIYRETNTSYSLRVGLEQLHDYDTVYVLEGDVFFAKNLLVNLSLDIHNDATMLEPYNINLDGTFVTMNDKHYVTDWIHKKYRNEDFTFDNKYKTVNLHKFSKSFVDSTMMPMLEVMNNKTEQIEPLERAMQSIVRNNRHIVYGMETNGAKWVEIDDCNDLKLAESVFGDEENG